MCHGPFANDAIRPPYAAPIWIKEMNRRSKNVPAWTTGPHAPVSGVALLAVLDATTVVLVDRYPSRLNGGQGECGAGEESFVRIVRLRPAPARKLWQVKLASCWQDIEADGEYGDQGLHWSADTRELQIRWLQGPALKGPETRRLRLDASGAVKELTPA